MPDVLGFDHLYIAVSDMERAQAFYDRAWVRSDSARIPLRWVASRTCSTTTASSATCSVRHARHGRTIRTRPACIIFACGSTRSRMSWRRWRRCGLPASPRPPDSATSRPILRLFEDPERRDRHDGWDASRRAANHEESRLGCAEHGQDRSQSGASRHAEERPARDPGDRVARRGDRAQGSRCARHSRGLRILRGFAGGSRRSRPSTIRCPTTCTCRSRCRRPRRASTCCARSRSR